MKFFTCPNVPTNLRLTKKGCAKYFKLANRNTKYRQNQGVSSAYYYCRSCSIGKTNYKYYFGKLKKKEKEEKECQLHEILPEWCESKHRKGIFQREFRHCDYDWEHKKFCCDDCALKYHYLLRKGKIK